MKLKDLLNENILGDLPSSKLMKMKWNPLAEVSAEEVDAEIEAADAQIDAAKAKSKASAAAEKDTIKSAKDKIKAAKAQMKVAEEGVIIEDHEGYTFGTGDIVNNRDVSCDHHGSKGFVIQLSADDVKYSVTNGGDGTSYKPGDVLTKHKDQLEKI